MLFEVLAALNAPAWLQHAGQYTLVGSLLLFTTVLTFRWAVSKGQGAVPGDRPTASDVKIQYSRLKDLPSDIQPPASSLKLLTSSLSLWLTAFLLTSPQVLEHHYIMLLPVLIWDYIQRPNWVTGAICLLLALPTPFGFIGLQPVIAANHDLRAFALEPAWQPVLQHLSKAGPALWLYLHLARQILI